MFIIYSPRREARRLAMPQTTEKVTKGAARIKTESPIQTSQGFPRSARSCGRLYCSTVLPDADFRVPYLAGCGCGRAPCTCKYFESARSTNSLQGREFRFESESRAKPPATKRRSGATNPAQTNFPMPSLRTRSFVRPTPLQTLWISEGLTRA